MKPRFWIAIVTYFIAALSAGCTYGLARPQAEPSSSRLVDATSRAIFVTETARMENDDRLKRAAAFHDYGRYYK
jgi:hypothetical protein